MSETTDAMFRYADVKGRAYPGGGWRPKKKVVAKFKPCPCCAGVFTIEKCLLCGDTKRIRLDTAR